MPSIDLGYMTASLEGTDAPSQEHSVHIGSRDLLISDTGRGADHLFEMHAWRHEGATVETNWVHSSGWYQNRSNWPSSEWNDATMPYLAGINPGILASRMLAGTNPTRSNVLIPNIVFEFRDLPRMYKDAGDLLLGALKPSIRKRKKDNLAASQYLAYNYGWAPLISDMKKLLQFTESVNKRTQEWNRLYSSGGLKRRYKLGTLSAEDTTTGDAPDGLGNFEYQRKISRKSWGTVRWRPTNPRTGVSSRPNPVVIRNQILGLSRKNIAENIWESLPWSWLTDWFTNVGDMIVATQGRSQVTPTGICIMAHTRGEHVTPYKTIVQSGSWSGAATLTSGGYKSERKERFLPAITLQADMGIFSPHQLSILASLALLRAR